MITYLDRACIATLAPGIIKDLGLTTVQMGYVFTVFQLAYALFEIPDGVVGGSRGTRAVLSRIVLWWSCLTAATARGVQLSGPARRALSVRRRRGGRLAVRGAHVLPMDSPARARNGSGHLLRRRAPGRRADAGAGAVAAPLPVAGARFSSASAASAWCGRRCGSRGSATTRRSTRRSNAAELQTIVSDRPADIGHAAGIGILAHAVPQPKHDGALRDVHPRTA